MTWRSPNALAVLGAMVMACSGASSMEDARDAGPGAGDRTDARPWPDGDGPPDDGPSAELYAADQLPHFHIDLTPESLDALRANPRTYARGSFRYGDEIVDDVGVRLRGHSSFRTIDEKAGFKIKFDKFVANQTFRGLERLNLNNAAGDPSYIAERLAYRVFRAGNVPAPRANSALVSVNGDFYGVYVNVEVVDEKFLDRWYADSGGNLYEAEFADVAPGPVPRCAVSSDTGCFDLETNEKADDWSGIEALFAALSDPGFTAVEQTDHYFELQRFLRYSAMEVLVNQFDGYGYGSPELPPNNYRVYHEPSVDRFSLIPWGMDHSMKPLPLDSDRTVYFGGTGAYMLFYCLADDGCRTRYTSLLLEGADLYDSLDLADEAVAMKEQIAEWVTIDPRVGIANGSFAEAVDRVIYMIGIRTERVRADVAGGLL